MHSHKKFMLTTNLFIFFCRSGSRHEKMKEHKDNLDGGPTTAQSPSRAGSSSRGVDGFTGVFTSDDHQKMNDSGKSSPQSQVRFSLLVLFFTLGHFYRLIFLHQLSKLIVSHFLPSLSGVLIYFHFSNIYFLDRWNVFYFLQSSIESIFWQSHIVEDDKEEKFIFRNGDLILDKCNHSSTLIYFLICI